MSKPPFPYPVYEFRPYEGGFNSERFSLKQDEVLRYAKGAWIPDDGQYDLAFIIPNHFIAMFIDIPYKTNIKWSLVNLSRRHIDGTPWHYQLRGGYYLQEWDSSNRIQHPNLIASASAISKLTSIQGCANGYGVDITDVGDPTLCNGLVRNVETKKPLVPPKSVTCTFCGHRFRTHPRIYQ